MDQLKEQTMDTMHPNPSRQLTDTEPESEDLDMISAEDITVAIFCALPFESVAVKYTLDKEFDCRPKTIGPRKYVYSFGLIGDHKVVIARPNQMGNVKAAQCAATVSQQFPNVRFALLIGIGAGIPSLSEGDLISSGSKGSRPDIRLGDVAVSIPSDGHPGVVEYDYGKYEADGKFLLKGSLNKPHPILIRNDCTGCLNSTDKRTAQHVVNSAEPVVHRGLILSGSGVVKNPEDRLRLRRGHANAICFEMEAAGIVDEIPCLVVRGISDFADTNKDDRWHYYAAAVAAAYGKAILLKIYGEELQETETMKEALKKLDVVDQKLIQLQTTGENTLTVMKEMKDSMTRHEIKLDMDKLPYARGAMFSSKDQERTTCHPRTRVDLLRQIKDWIQRPNSKSIFWLNGSAGTGKSTISWTIAKWLTSESCNRVVDLGASFFFKRGEADRSSASLFFPTIVRQLVFTIPGLDVLISGVIESDPFIFDKSLSEQFDKLLFQPLCKISSSLVGCPILVLVVDALDECETERDVKCILQLWSRLYQMATIRLRLLLTSRPELPIRVGFKNIPDIVYQNMSVDVYQDAIVCNPSRQTTIQHDIYIFLDEAFLAFRKGYKAPLSEAPLDDGWPGKEDLKALVDMAVPLFIVAATIHRFVTDEHYNPKDQLRKVLKFRGTGNLKQMEQTYLPVLEQLSATFRNSDNEKALCTECRMILGSIVALAEPLSRASLAIILQISLDTLELRLDPLHSVLRIPNDFEAPIQSLHLSFREFVLSSNPQHILQIPGPKAHNLLLTKCLQLLSGNKDLGSRGLRENMCDLKYPGQPRREIKLTEINRRLSPGFQYACRYWVHHAQQSNSELHDEGQEHVFLKKHFLHWLEAMSLINRLVDVIAYLDVLLSLVQSQNSIELRNFLDDARRFILAHRQIVDLAPLQLYSSALGFSPQHSIIRKIYGQCPKWLRELPITSTTWGPELQKLEGHTEGRPVTIPSNYGTQPPVKRCKH
ncbi:hypothetical protein NQ176_g4626 [Zarea fungicola]|uniref:Uncharacterized protein n=1 Tax=Zarea fungicola TaxID=93591 RepID=A0ACC1NDW0_9HYPO|nr:hypothetical protein NQ176_g4626 [Lecanicillium fungicola]